MFNYRDTAHELRIHSTQVTSVPRLREAPPIIIRPDLFTYQRQTKPNVVYGWDDICRHCATNFLKNNPEIPLTPEALLRCASGQAENPEWKLFDIVSSPLETDLQFVYLPHLAKNQRTLASLWLQYFCVNYTSKIAQATGICRNYRRIRRIEEYSYACVNVGGGPSVSITQTVSYQHKDADPVCSLEQTIRDYCEDWDIDRVSNKL